MSKNTLSFALRCPIELLEEHKGTARYRFDTRLLGGDYTIVTLPSVFMGEQSARLKLFEELTRWNQD